MTVVSYKKCTTMFFLWLILNTIFWSLPILWTIYTIYWQRSSRCLPGCFSLDVVIDYWSSLVYFIWSKASCGPRIYVYWFGLKNYKTYNNPLVSWLRLCYCQGLLYILVIWLTSVSLSFLGDTRSGLVVQRTILSHFHSEFNGQHFADSNFKYKCFHHSRAI